MKSLPRKKEEAFARPFDLILLESIARKLMKLHKPITYHLPILLRSVRFELSSISANSEITDGHFCGFYQYGVRKHHAQHSTKYRGLGVKSIEIMDSYLAQRGLEEFVNPSASSFRISKDFHPVFDGSS